MKQQLLVEMGVTIAKNPSEISGSNATKLNSVGAVVINADQTRMYVSDVDNRQVQRFDLI